MMYPIQSKNDLTSGTTLVVCVPEEEIDQKALYTIQAEQPEFVLPFRHRSVDGQVEFTFQIGVRSKMMYLSGSRAPEEYVELWTGILKPLLDCGDWFMNPYSFVLSADYLFYDKAAQKVCYLYIPAVRPCADYEMLKQMVMDISGQNRVTDLNLETQVLRALLQEFNPREFLQMLKAFRVNGTAAASAVPVPPVLAPAPAAAPKPLFGAAAQPVPQVVSPPVSPAPVQTAGQASASGDIVINLNGGGVPAKAPKEKGKGFQLFGGKEKDAKKEKSSGLFGKKKGDGEVIFGGAAAPAPMQRFEPAPAYVYAADAADGHTELEPAGVAGPGLRLVGDGALPPQIKVAAEAGMPFSVGRYDVALKRQQSSFEFDAKVKAVSRRHAIIEKTGDGYAVIDLASSAGTFVDGRKIPPNTPVPLQSGCRVSFGNLGADYIWEA